MVNLKIFLVLTGLIFLSGFVNALTVVNNCTSIETPDVYEVNGSLTNITSSGSSCINITVSNVVLNLNGTRVDRASGGSSEAAIYVYNFSYLTNVTVANGTVNASNYGVYFNRVENSTIRNIIGYNTTTAFLIFSSASNIILNNTAYNSTPASSATALSTIPPIILIHQEQDFQ